MHFPKRGANNMFNNVINNMKKKLSLEDFSPIRKFPKWVSKTKDRIISFILK